MKNYRYLIVLLLLFITSIAHQQPKDNAIQETEKAQLLIKKGEQLFAEQQYQAAIDTLHEAIKIYKSFPHSNINRCYHKIYQCLVKLNDWDALLTYGHDALQNFYTTEKNIENDTNYIEFIKYIGDAHERKVENMDSIEHYFLKAIDLYEKRKPFSNYKIGLAHFQISYPYLQQGYIEEGRYHVQEAEKYWKKTTHNVDDELNKLYSSMSKMYMSLNAMDLAEEYEKKTLQIADKIHSRESSEYAIVLGNNANFYSGKNDLVKAKEVVLEGIEILENLSDEQQSYNGLKAVLYNNLGNYCKMLMQVELSEKALLKSLELNPNYPSARVNLADLYTKKRYGLLKNEAAIEILQPVEDLLRSINSPFLAAIYTVKANAYKNLDMLDTTFAYYNRAVNITIRQDENTEIDRFLLVDVDSLHNEHINRKIYKNRATLMKDYASRTGKLEDWENALKHSLFVVEMFDEYFKTIPYIQRAKNTEIKESYERAIGIAFELYTKTNEPQYLEQGLQLSEQFKGNDILGGMNDAKAKTEVKLPQELLKKEEDVKIKLTTAKAKFFDAKKAKDTELIKQRQEELFTCQQNYEALMENFEKNYPKYFNLKYQTASVTLADLQQKVIQPNQALVEYFVGDEALYTWNIQKDKVDFYKKTEPKELRPLVENLRENITDYTSRAKNSQTAFKDYTSNATQLFDILLKKVVADKSIERLLIVPDEALNFLSFETLLTQAVDTNQVNYKSLPYLVKDYSIAYTYASKLLLQKRKRSPKQYLAAFAPAYEQFAENDTANSNTLAMLVRDGEVQLPGAQKEVKTITEQYQGIPFIGKNANEKSFKENASKYQILHLSMHALMDAEYPMRSHLVFEKDASQEDNLLQIGELYNMNIPADMVVLSACNSGLGRVRTGDGVQSLATAFNYAGAKSTVMSLWKVPDQSTAPMMIDFYEQLHTKQTKDNALRQAKLNYLDEAVADELAHPLYWAGFIASGDMSPISKSSNGWIWWIIGSLGVIVLAFAIRKRLWK